MKPVRALDVETYKNYFLVKLLDLSSGQEWEFEHYEGKPLDVTRLKWVLNVSTLVTFNGNHFDLPVIALALKGATCQQIKDGANAIIGRGLKSWQFEKEFKCKVPEGLDHIDLIEVAPGTASLKIYGGRLQCPRMQDLPIEHFAEVTPEQRPLLRAYCGNDLLITKSLYEELLPQLRLRERLSKQYDIDLRSKSDAQIAEAVICSEVSQSLAIEIVRPEVQAYTAFKYERPACIQFTTEPLQQLAAFVAELDFVVQPSGVVKIPKALADYKIKIGQAVYRMGIGGLHSTEKSVSYRSDEAQVLLDRDVVSYYPTLIMRNRWAPKQMGSAFLKTFGSILERRVAAKRAGDKVAADSLKITVNGSFGKLGSKWSKLYAPHLMIQTTISGQLALLMLIESIEAQGIPVVSANTDGVMILCQREDELALDVLVGQWEAATGLETEGTEYRALHSRDVNNYIAIKPDGKVKLKGIFAPVGLQKNPTNEICITAAAKFLRDGVPIEETVLECRDIRRFVTVRKVAGGAMKDGLYLGKAVRWYYATGVEGEIQQKLNGYKVSRSEGARPVMDLPDDLPEDINYQWYIDEAESIVKDVGA